MSEVSRGGGAGRGDGVMETRCCYCGVPPRSVQSHAARAAHSNRSTRDFLRVGRGARHGQAGGMSGRCMVQLQYVDAWSHAWAWLFVATPAA